MEPQYVEYYVNVSYNGKPFYVIPTIVNEDHIRILKNYNPDVGVYYLFLKGVIVYVGVSSKNVQERILLHMDDKEFDSYFIFTCLNEDDRSVSVDLLKKLIKMEPFLIRTFKPHYNVISNISLREATLSKQFENSN